MRTPQRLGTRKQERVLVLPLRQGVLTPAGPLSGPWVTSAGHLSSTKGLTVSHSQEMPYYHCQSHGLLGNLSDWQDLILSMSGQPRFSSDAYLGFNGDILKSQTQSNRHRWNVASALQTWTLFKSNIFLNHITLNVFHVVQYRCCFLALWFWLNSSHRHAVGNVRSHREALIW